MKKIVIATFIVSIIIGTLVLALYFPMRPAVSPADSIPINSESIPQYLVDKITAIEQHTQFDYNYDGWSLYGIITIISALVSVVIAYVTYSAQESVEKHTKNVSVSAQRGSLIDLLRHLYRNAVCTGTILHKFRSDESKGKAVAESYPSEANMLKLQTQTEIYILPIDIVNDDIFGSMTKMRKLMQNYNCEIDVATMHFSTKGLPYESLRWDYDNLLYKPFRLCKESLELYTKLLAIDNSKESKKERSASHHIILEFFYEMIKEHIKNLPDNMPSHMNKIKELIALPNDEFFKTICGSEVRKSGLYRGFDDMCKMVKDTENDKSYTYSDGIFMRSAKGEPLQINRVALINYYCERVGKPNDTKPWNEKIENFKKLTEGTEGMKAYFDLWEIETKVGEVQRVEMCDCFDLFMTIAKVDILLEWERIGMIKFSSEQ